MTDEGEAARPSEEVDDPQVSDDSVVQRRRLIPKNLLLADGRLVGVLDTGGFGPTDPALDLVAAGHLLDGRARLALWAELGCDAPEWDRGKAWAFEQAIGVAWYYQETNPAMHQMGMTTLRRLLASQE